MQKSELPCENTNPAHIDLSAGHLHVSSEAAVALYKVGCSINRLCRRLSTLLQGELNKLGIEDIGPIDLMLLLTLRGGCSSIGDLGEQSGVKGPKLTYYINNLETHAYIERSISQQSRRAYKLTMLPKAVHVCAAMDLAAEQLAGLLEQDSEKSQEMAITFQTLLQIEQSLDDLARQHN